MVLRQHFLVISELVLGVNDSSFHVTSIANCLVLIFESFLVLGHSFKWSSYAYERHQFCIAISIIIRLDDSQHVIFALIAAVSHPTRPLINKFCGRVSQAFSRGLPCDSHMQAMYSNGYFHFQQAFHVLKFNSASKSSIHF